MEWGGWWGRVGRWVGSFAYLSDCSYTFSMTKQLAQWFPLGVNRLFRYFLGMTFAFQPFELFHLLVYNKWSPVYPLLARH